jgi:hypothetical protein
MASHNANAGAGDSGARQKSSSTKKNDCQPNSRCHEFPQAPPCGVAGVARNIAEVIDDLYRSGAVPRHRERLLDLVQVQVEHAMRLGAQQRLGYESEGAE